MAKIDVLIPVKDGGHTIEESIKSILWQTEKDFRIILIDDSSGRDTREILERLSENEAVKLVNSDGSGIVDALNTGLLISDALFVARMDADDISLPSRFERQLEVFEYKNSVAMCGTGVVRFGSEHWIPSIPVTNVNCHLALSLFNPFYHPTVMIRRNFLDYNKLLYDARFPIAQDYKLFSDISLLGEICNISDPLLLYRVHNKQVSFEKKGKQNRAAYLIALEHIRNSSGLNLNYGPSAISYMSLIALRLGTKNMRRSLNALKNHMNALTVRTDSDQSES